MSKTHILLAEDHPDIRESLVEFLEMMGFKVSSTDNLHDAKEIVHHVFNKPDIVLTDMEFLEKEGVNKEDPYAGNKLAELAHEKGIPVIGMTAKENKHFNEKFVVKQLKKPIPFDVLKTLLQELMSELSVRDKTVLIVDDGKLFLKSLEFGLKNMFKVLTAEDLEEAERLAPKADLILTDGVYPREGVPVDVQGHDKTYSGNILAEKFHKHKKIIGLSAEPRFFVEKYFDEVMQKPVDLVVLRKTIIRLLNEK